MILEHLKRQLRRPHVALLLVAAGALWLFPRLAPRELVLHHRMPAATCAKDLAVSVYDGESLVRRHARALDGASDVTHALSLPRGRYRVRVEVGCGERGALRDVERTISLDGSTEASFDLSRLCPCS
ncbi:hypothetical protein L6R52_25590 [Myxococcota bacterium]|nr:hypothetical protein [Myxococcota bacterium]